MSLRTLKNTVRQLLRISDKERWAKMENHDTSWSGRTEVMSRFIRAGESVFEFGAGRCHLKTLLPPVCRYTPSDIVSRREGTYVCDLNQRPLPEFPPHDVAVCSGVLEYVHDLPGVAQGMSRAFGRLIISYADVGRNPKRKARLRNGWFNHLDRRRFLTVFTAAGYRLVEETEWNRHGIYVLEKI